MTPESLIKLSKTHPELALTKAIAAITIMKEALEEIKSRRTQDDHGLMGQVENTFNLAECHNFAKEALKQIEEL